MNWGYGGQKLNRLLTVWSVILGQSQQLQYLIADMFSDHYEYDRRRYPRMALGLKGSMAFGPCMPRCRCMIADISEGGARLDVGLLLDPPERFGLSLPPARVFRRECRLVWRREFDIGIKFIDT
jgi:PilZ domain-containing protein